MIFHFIAIHSLNFMISHYIVSYVFPQEYFIIFHDISLHFSIYVIPQKYVQIFHFPCHFITRSLQREKREGSLSRRRRTITARTESEEQRRKEDRQRRRYEHEERMAQMREEARQRDEEQKKLEAESKRADQELKEAQALLEEERKQIMDMLLAQNKELKLEQKTKNQMETMEASNKEMQERLKNSKILVEVKEEKPSSDEDFQFHLFFFTTIFPISDFPMICFCCQWFFCFPIVKLYPFALYMLCFCF